MPSPAAVAQVKDAYRIWNDSKGGRPEVFLDLMADQVAFHSMGDLEPPGLAFARSRTSKEDVVAYFSSLNEEWSMVHWTPHVFVVEGDHVALFGACAWTHKLTGKMAEVRIALLLRYDGDKIVEVTEIFDSARAMAAAAV